MGDPKKTKKHYETPGKMWDKDRITKEKELGETFGLKNRKEVWLLKTLLKKKRENARELLALPLEQRIKRQEELLGNLNRLGILDKNSSLDDVLSLSVEDFLERRLQTIVWRTGLANTPKQARQFIIHGHIAIGERRVTTPGYLVTASEEKEIKHYNEKIRSALKPQEVKKVVKVEKAAKIKGKAAEAEEGIEAKPEVKKKVEEGKPEVAEGKVEEKAVETVEEVKEAMEVS